MKNINFEINLDYKAPKEIINAGLEADFEAVVTCCIEGYDLIKAMLMKSLNQENGYSFENAEKADKLARLLLPQVLLKPSEKPMNKSKFIFRKSLWAETSLNQGMSLSYVIDSTWPNSCDGQEVEMDGDFGRIESNGLIYTISKQWCEEVTNGLLDL